MNEERATALEDILIVDDTPANLHLLSQILTDQGYRVRAVTSGPQAIKSAQITPPDLILLDVMMPKMNGYQVCQHLKADERTFDIPIIFISAMDTTDDKVEGFAAGGADYVTKPFQVDEVLARVEVHLAVRNLQKHLERAKAAQEARLTAMADELDQPLAAIARDTGRLKAIIQQRDRESFEKSAPWDKLLQIEKSLEENVAQCRQAIGSLAPDRASEEQSD
jgi:DNA-binding response OmpR family regulator